MITIEAVGNAADHDLWSTVRSLFRERAVVKLRCAISFVMESGVTLAAASLSRLTDRGVEVAVIFGDDFHLSQSRALQRLMQMGCELRLHSAETHPGFHPKIWLFDYDDGTRAVVVGSSNLSKGGLQTNAEASVVMRGNAKELDAFDTLWNNFYDESHQFTSADLESYVDSERVSHVPSRSASATSRVNSVADLVSDHVSRWQRFIASPRRIGQHERWRGWYLVPEQGQITLAKLRELADVLDQVSLRPQYKRQGLASFGTDAAGVANAVAVLRGAKITTLGQYSDRERRDLFTRQQRLYLQTFGLIEQISPGTFRITSIGERFRRAATDRVRRHIYTEALSLKKWPFGPIAFYPLLREVIERVPDRRLYYDEMNLIVIHTYHHAERDGIVNLVVAYRGLPVDDRLALAEAADRRIRVLLDRHAGATAYGRYRRKVADLMVAFGTTTGFRYVAAPDEDRSYIERTR